MSPPTVVSAPKVSVLMAVRNGGAFLEQALASMSAQTWHDYELIVVDDGSTDGSGDRVLAFAGKDRRLRLLRQAPLGLVEALNRAAGEARGELWARMDADDIAHPERLQRQLEFLARRPEVGVLGTAVRRFGAAHGRWRLPESDPAAKAALLFGTPFAHPTVMLRRAVWKESGGGYRPEFRAAEDIDLWERLAPHTRFANLPEVMLDYRVHPAQVTAMAGDSMARNGARVRERVIRALGLRPSDAERTTHEAVAWLRRGSLTELAAARSWLERLVAAESGSPAERAARRSEVARRWFEFCNCHSRLGREAWRVYREASFRSADPTSLSRRLRFLLLCAVGPLRFGGLHV